MATPAPFAEYRGHVKIGEMLIWLGAALAAVGALLRLGAFAWFGNLPGDIRLEGESHRVFVPITSMIVLSVVLTLVANLFGGWFRDR